MRCSEVHGAPPPHSKGGLRGEDKGPKGGNRSTYLKMDLKSDFFYFFQTICFWKAESLCFKNL